MRRFLIKISYTVLPLWIAWMGLMCYYNLVVLPNQHGDLGEVGRIPFKLFYERPAFHDFPKVLFEDVKAPEELKKSRQISLPVATPSHNWVFRAIKTICAVVGKRLLTLPLPRSF